MSPLVMPVGTLSYFNRFPLRRLPSMRSIRRLKQKQKPQAEVFSGNPGLVLCAAGVGSRIAPA